MLQYLIDKNNLWPQFESCKLTDIDLIAGPIQPSTSLKQNSSSHHWSYQGRPINKSILYEVWAVLMINLLLFIIIIDCC